MNSLADHPLWDSEVFLLSGGDREELAAAATLLIAAAEQPDEAESFASFAAAEFEGHRQQEPGTKNEEQRLAIVAADRQDLAAKLRRAIARLEDGAASIRDISGIYFTANPIGLPRGGVTPKVSILFPGEGSQYPGMLSDLAVLFPHVAEILEHCHSLNENSRHQDLSPALLFLPQHELPEATRAEIESLSKRIDFAVFTVFIADWILHTMLERLAVRSHAVAGHSAGEFIALMAAGVLQGNTTLFKDMGEGFRELGKYTPPNEEPSRLLALAASRQKAAAILEEAASNLQPEGSSLSCYVAMENCPRQTVIVGTSAHIEKVEKIIRRAGVMYQSLELAQPYHTPLFDPYMRGLRAIFESFQFHAPLLPIYSCATGDLFPDDPRRILDLSLEHWEKPVRFVSLIESQYRDGVRCFIEAGPRNNLSSFAEDILRGKDVLILPANSQRLSSISQINHLVAQLHVHHFEVDPAFLYESRRLESPAAEPCPETVMDSHWQVMTEFLQLQRELMEHYLAGTAPALPSAITPPAEPQAPDLTPFPMLDEIIEFVPQHRLAVIREMTLEEDLFANQHTVGGRELSQINPRQYGLPVVPMTFSIEMIAEAAEALLPGLQVIAMRDIKLTKWLDYHVTVPSHASVVVEVAEPGGPGDVWLVHAQLFHWHGDEAPARPAVVATVELASAMPEPPDSVPLSLHNERPTTVTCERLYKNLFHGEEFQGTLELGRFGDNGIEALIETLPRPRLFSSNPEPLFAIDPVLLDVALHPMCAWHLEQPDQSGRILLPIGVDRLEFHGRRPQPGTRFYSRATISRETTRQFTHEVEIVDLQGKTWCRMIGCHYWRFYLPYRQYNFHGPKNIYMLSEEWAEIRPLPGCKVMLLDVPSDLRNPTMQPIAARVSLSERELAEFFQLDLTDERRTEWLFGRVAMKDAVRALWHEMTGERLFTADIEISHDEFGKPLASLRGRETPPGFPEVSLSHCGPKMVSLAVSPGQAGVDIEKITPRQPGFLKIAFNDRERKLLASLDPENAEWVARLWCAKEAVGKCLGRGLSDGPRGIEIVAANPESGEALCRLGPGLLKLFPEYAQRLLCARTYAAGKMAAALATGETLRESEVHPPLNRVQ